jgi:LacI family transcriptional regulator
MARGPQGAPNGTATGTATIGQVATAAGVSRATVSRVMNGHPTVAPAIAERVRAAAADLQYRPSRVARSLSLGRTNTVALVVPDLGNPMFQQILRGVMGAAAPHDYRVLVAETVENADDEAEVALEARQRCDALILAAPRTSEATLRTLLPRVEPVVLVNRRVPGLSTPTVRVDYAAGVRSVVDHLVALGHHDLAYAAGPRTSVSNAARVRALDEARERHPRLRVTTVPCGSTVDAGYCGADTVLATGATGVVAFNDLVAFGLLARLGEAGVAVPQDISIGGFDDIELARYATPSLTTATVPQADLGRRAWELLHARVTGGADGGNGHTGAGSLVTPGLVVRSSTGPVPPARRLATTSNDMAGRTTARHEADRARWRVAEDDWVLGIDVDRPLARLTRGAGMPGVHSPRPALHPVHSLRGVAMTDASPVDHRHHYGASMAVPDVNGTTYWGGRTYVRDQGSTLLANHGRQELIGATVVGDGATVVGSVRWVDQNDAVQLTEERRLTAVLLPEVDTWALGSRSVLVAGDRDLEIGSPATNGRPQAGYGGFFWRLPSADEAHALAPGAADEASVHGLGGGGGGGGGGGPGGGGRGARGRGGGRGAGRRGPAGGARAAGPAARGVAVSRPRGGGWTTLVLVQTAPEADPWFVRVADNVGLGPALAWDRCLINIWRGRRKEVCMSGGGPV